MSSNRYTASATIEREGREFTGTAVAWKHSRSRDDIVYPVQTLGQRFGEIARQGKVWWLVLDEAPRQGESFRTLTEAVDHAAIIAAEITRESTLAEEEEARQAEPADEVTTACFDCGQQVPVLRAGRGDFSLDRCPSSTGGFSSHRVPRNVFDATERLKYLQRRIASSSA